ncbi:MAG: glycoside hydrolase family 3 [Phycisphaerae bacterium]|nr:glycoside hydrolase family 3 [Phycisphaerae bacterium]MBM90749.1 glycoside hydrolase family 3 [Phycisphaerae bacterium]
MTLAELIGASLMLGIRGCSVNQSETRSDLEALTGIHCKGIVLFDHDIAGNHPRNVLSPEQLEKFIADLRHELGEDLIVAIDQEGGQVSRLKQEQGFLPSVSAEEFASWEEIDQRQYAQRQAKQLKRLGIDLNLAPCVDLAVEPHSPIIAEKGRSFGVDHDKAVRCASIMIQGHMDEGVRCCIKHFPGHGSSLIDSHLGMCDITQTHTPDETRVFASLIECFGDEIAVMPGHLIDKRVDERLPASLSSAHLSGALRSMLGFEGVIISDSLDMRAVMDQYGDGRSAAMAISAGCDLVIDGLNAPGYREPEAPVRIADAIAKAIGSGRIPHGEERLTQSRARVDRLFGR